MSGVPFPARGTVKFFLFAIASRPALGPIQSPIHWVMGPLSPGLKWPRREADHWPPSSAKAKNEWSYTFTPPYIFMAWYLIKQGMHFHCVVLNWVQGQLYIYFCFEKSVLCNKCEYMWQTARQYQFVKSTSSTSCWDEETGMNKFSLLSFCELFVKYEFRMSRHTVWETQM